MSRERPIQRAVVAYLRQVLPDAIVHHSVNEQALSGRDRRGAAIAMRNAKLDGMSPGFPDVIVLSWAHMPVMLFEVKAEGGRLTQGQRATQEHLRTLGHKIAVVRSVDDVREALAEWGIASREVVKIPMKGTII